MRAAVTLLLLAASPAAAASALRRPQLLCTTALETLDGACLSAESGLRSLRRQLRSPALAPSTVDAALAGAAGGWLTGKVLVGDPKWMAAAGAASFAWAHRFPQRSHTRLCALARKPTRLVRRLRSRLASAL